MTQESLLQKLSGHVLRPVDAPSRARARLHLLDWLACVMGARGSAIHAASRAIGSPLKQAALMANLLEMDDVHRGALLHPGPVIWPCALQNCGDMAAALDHAVRGYEAMIDVGTTLDDAHYAHWHPTATAGVVGAAAARGSAHGLDGNQMIWALANAASVAGGLWHMRHDDVMTKQWHVLHATNVGEEVAALAAAGVTGPRAILEGEQGLYAAMCRTPKPLVLPDQWRIHEVSFKPWAACRHAHPVIDCALELRASGRLQAPFQVESYADALTFCNRPDPASEVEAKFSLQHAVAVIADGRHATPQDFAPDAIAALAPLRAQVTVAEDPAITARYPSHFGARVNGLELADTRGDPERPLDREGLFAKVHSLFGWGGLTSHDSDRAIKICLESGDAAAVTTLLEDWLK